MTVLAVVGCGPRGLNLLERLVSRWRTGTVHVIEPNELGSGLHRPDQPDYLLLNTVAAQLTAFVDPQMVQGGGVRGPSLYEWLTARGVKVASNTGELAPVRESDYLPRALLGQYLEWAAQQILAVAPAGLEILHHRATALSVTRVDGRENIRLSDGTSLHADHVVLTVGHTGVPAPAAPDPAADPRRWIATPYPLPDAVGTVPPGATVGLLGAGLTATDLLAALTVGRGGRYEPAPGGLRYLPSGAEPHIVLSNRFGVPPRARPRAYDRTSPLPTAFLDRETIDGLRRLTTDGRLDFAQDVLPLFVAEARYRYRAMGGEGELDVLSNGVPEPALTNHQEYAAWCRAAVREDLAEAQRGLDSSPAKNALEVFRDYRELLRDIVGAPGLSADSLADFFGRITALSNRTVTGPHLERHEELLALIEAEVVRFGPGPDPSATWDENRHEWVIASTRLRTAAQLRSDYLVAAYSRSPTAQSSSNPVLVSLAGENRLRSMWAGGLELGIMVDSDDHLINGIGEVESSISAFGPTTEGSSYYNHYITSPGLPMRVLAAMDRVVTMLA
ncbi:FAD/NAD(P)-binding protein [Kitasatospora sp. GP82]|uniref:FAD/NAD(P)-binding protein n=1 Tax=Kitasatospora sp. GP82 TaxID=3035089 RepID=UPI002474F0CA|nr:FAD/NAD(P)-binding protein [Kitasatospora sp. GP82]MDH6125382.1 putative NAD(P)/FAD-binding protein YdhS [Kitasatospora sp. GP82]